MLRPLLAILVLAGASAAPAAAQPTARVRFDEALDLADHAPAVEGTRRALAAREAGDEGIGGTARATQITAMPGAAIAPDQEQGFELQVNVTQGWNLGDLGGARRRSAAREREALRARARAEALRARIEAARRWLDLRALERLEASLEARVAVVRERVDATERAMAAGLRTEADLADARALAAELAQARLRIHGERFEAATQLAEAMGRAPLGDDPETMIVTAGAAPTPELPSPEGVRARLASLDELPDVTARRLAETAARAREVEAAARYAPVLQLGAQLERTAADVWVLYGIAGLSFSAFGQGDRDVALARAEAEEAAGRAEAARVRARAALTRATHEVEHTRRRLASLEERLLPALETLRARRERALELGEGTVFEVMEARRRELEARAWVERARGARRWAEVRLWLLLSELERGAEEAP
ncbi:MAG TPA: TolC family protein [Sandaracinaceae bacterium LLY-WYZ-13_1]|nr:TolC family protein [Sandaracinaceae bacterium LLY-WYZ-13_1]